MRPCLRRLLRKYRPHLDLGKLPVELRYAHMGGLRAPGAPALAGLCMHTPRGCLILVDPDHDDLLDTVLHELVHAEQINLGLSTEHDARFEARLRELHES